MEVKSESCYLVLWAGCKGKARVAPSLHSALMYFSFHLDRLGGPDPLDFISMFSNPGNPLHGIPPHWHYVSSGLSDLHGDGRVHE